ncbi:SDR family NAD(P)-dependent oxidoreductase [Clostridium taeniosporum]|uniref:Short-chain dehydrogenase n=1 Tax=Clostridium taeniosporum TaxID=394958 RepID=A0A1D7XK73_9CLOT|nr:SDR family NAD(P)-dependent oxidoreductase [Clostridium taeniosporum]AOR23745.1 short-chain dehydrogenase [Clostridium taeniosporum]
MKKVLITGSGTGLGKDAAIALSSRGHYVYATTHTLEESKMLNKIAKKNNLPLKSFKLDILSANDRTLVDNLSIDVLINNAAIGDSGSVCEINVDRYRQTFETNVFSNIELTQRVLKNMIKKRSGRIVFVSSLVGRVTLPFLSPYTATKFAIEAIATSLKEELKELKSVNIDVALIEPGAYATGFNQKNISKQFTWMKQCSYFKTKINHLEKKQFRYFKLTERKNTSSIINEYIKSVEDIEVKDRYVAPCLQGTFIQIKRILGK